MELPIVDSEQISKLKNRDQAYLSEVFADVNPRLLGLLATRGIFAESAEELVHECWETFFSKLEKFEGRSHIRTFIFGILINKIREHHRRIGRTDFEEDSEKVFESSFVKNGWWAKEPTDPQLILANRQLGEALQDCLTGLTDSQRDAFLLIEADGETAEDACSVLGVSISNLRVLIFRAKDKLRKCLEGHAHIA